MGKVKVVKASAGSGKTFRLAYEYVKAAIEHPDSYRSTLAVTFTNKAAEEMKRRIIGEINNLAEAGAVPGKANPLFLTMLAGELPFTEGEIVRRARIVRSAVLHDYSRFTVLTIDKFFQRIIRAFVRELGIDTDFNIELHTDSVLSASADMLIEKSLTDKKLRGWLSVFIEEQIALGRRWDVRKDIVALGREIFKERYRMMDSHGSRELLEEVIKSSWERVSAYYEAMRSLAGEAITRIESAGLSPEDFAGGSRGFISFFYKAAVDPSELTCTNTVRDAAVDASRWSVAKLTAGRGDVRGAVPELQPILYQMVELHNKNQSIASTFGLLKDNYRSYALLGDLSDNISDICTERNILLIQDTNHIINRLIEGNDAPFIFEKVGNSFSRYMMDEFQDTSLTQWNNFRPLLNNALSQSAGSPVLIVGDIKQSIYRWRGGDWEILGRRVSESFADREEITLGRNFRSGGNIIYFNNNLIGSVVSMDSARMDAEVGAAHGAGSIDGELCGDLLGMITRAYGDYLQEPGDSSAQGCGYARVIDAPLTRDGDDTAEEERMVSLISEIQSRGYRAGDIAVLVRRNSEGVKIANMLLSRKSEAATRGVCLDVVTREALLLENSQAVRFVISCFRLACNIDHSISGAIYKRFLGIDIADDMPRNGKTFLLSLRRYSLDEAFERIVMEYSLGDDPANTPYLQAFHDLIISFSGTRVSDMPLFLKWWDEHSGEESLNLPDSRDAITILTIHKSKGLQYPVVIIPYATWSMNPSQSTLLWADTGQEPYSRLGSVPIKYKKAVAESYYAPHYYREMIYSHIDNINTLYVAVTRAEKELYLITSSERSSTTVGGLITASLKGGEDGCAVIGAMPGRIEEKDGETVFHFGVPVAVESEMKSPSLPTGGLYPTYDFEGRLRLYRAGDRYSDGDSAEAISPRSYGRLMHRIFESIEHSDEITGVLERFTSDGAISPEERERISAMCVKALSDPLVASWFGEGWERIRNENTIITPSDRLAVRRPDRVMMRGDSAVVVDYKFGQREEKKYLRQIGEYADLLRGMGYTDVKGYVWYIESGNIVEAV